LRIFPRVQTEDSYSTGLYLHGMPPIWLSCERNSAKIFATVSLLLRKRGMKKLRFSTNVVYLETATI